MITRYFFTKVMLSVGNNEELRLSFIVVVIVVLRVSNHLEGSVTGHMIWRKKEDTMFNCGWLPQTIFLFLK